MIFTSIFLFYSSLVKNTRNASFIAKSMVVFVFFVFLAVMHTTVSAQTEAGVPQQLSAAPITNNSILQNPIALQQGANSSVTYTAGVEIDKSIKNIISLKVIEKQYQTYIPESFTATLNLSIEYGASSTSTNSFTKSLTVTYDKQEGAKYNSANYLSFDNAAYVKVTIVDPPTITATVSTSFDFTKVIALYNEMQVVKYFDLAPNTGGTNTKINFNTSLSKIPNDATKPDELTVTWVALEGKGLNAYQLEWAWVEDEMLDYYRDASNNIDYNFLFRNNSTRIDLPLNKVSYNVPLYYDGKGKLYYRVRGVNYKDNGSRTDGPWSDVENYTFLGHGSSDNSSTTATASDNPFNWQVRISYAEEGKRKVVMQYFDGSLRGRQTVTKDNTTNTVVSAETFYDGQGRPAVQILPAPSISNLITYQNNLNTFNGQAAGTNPAAVFDLQPLIPTVGVPLANVPYFATGNGTSRYYSNANPEISIGSNKYIPDAEGYPYTVTRYTPDATGRIMAQSGVGIAMQMGSGHETKYYYGGATQQELNGLFGTEAGNYTHYFKNMVSDANGQMSVSYTDMHGRTVATALAGNAPNNLDPLFKDGSEDYSGQKGTNITRDLLGNGNNQVKNNRSIESVNSILVPVKENYNFTYHLTPESLQIASCTTNVNLCYDCMYDLEISITNESGDEAPEVWKFSNVQLNPDDNCSTAINPFTVVSGSATLSSGVITFSKELNVGSYSVRKTLTINESSYLNNRELYATKALCKTKQEIIDSIYAVLETASGCNSATPENCASCNDKLGSFNTYKTQYFSSINITSPTQEQIDAVQVMYDNQKALCNQLCNTSSQLLSTKRELMLQDMMPYAGQYAKDPLVVVTPSSAMTMYKKYDIFSTAGTGASTQPYYKYPLKADKTAGKYLNNSGQPDIIIHPDPTNDTYLNDLSAAGFQQLFNEEWAEALLPHHPEYDKLIYAETHLTSSYDFANTISQLSSYSTAATNSYVYSSSITGQDPFYQINDPSIIPGLKTTMDGYITYQYKDLGGGTYASMWQLAYIMVKCNNSVNFLSSCIPTAKFPTSGTTDEYSLLSNADKDLVWQAFAGLYMAERDVQINKYIEDKVTLSQPNTTPATDFTNLVSQEYQLHFPKNNAQLAQQLGWSWYPTTPGGNPTIPGSSSTSPCHSYIESWKQTLLQCPALSAHVNKVQIINNITSRMETVCLLGTDVSSPRGSSNVKPGTTGAVYQNFEEIINAEFAANSISISNLCNPYVIEFPKPYRMGPLLTTEVVSTLDTCLCAQFTRVKEKAAASLNISVGSLTLTQLNQYYNGLYGETMTQALYDALQNHCGEETSIICYTVYDTSRANPSEIPQNCTVINENQDENGTVLVQCAINQCQSYGYLLTPAQPLPSFLHCGFNLDRCLSCADLSSLTTSFRSVFSPSSTYNAAPAPNFTGTNLGTTDIEKNTLFAKYVNYKTGFQFSWMDYAQATAGASPACNLDNYTSNSSATQKVICPDTKPLTDTTGFTEEDSPCKHVKDMATMMGTQIYETRLQSKLFAFDAFYLAKCLAAKEIETFKVEYLNSEYHYTLYYYDQAGNLVKTVPPKGVKPQFDLGFYNEVEDARAVGAVRTPDHVLVTNYRYNSLNQVIAQNTPDAHTATFWYDRLGRLAVSQNAQQSTERNYSYTVYDAIGRITEVGQKNNDIGMTDAIALDDNDLNDWVFNTGGDREQLTQTFYDEAVTSMVGSPTYLTQQNLRSRVSYTWTKKLSTQTLPDAATYYTYDVHGNVNELVQDHHEAMSLLQTPGANRFKKIVYRYDLVSGKVNEVSYQPGQPDAFYHRYSYDAENRITKVQTSRDKILWQQQAAYNYYKHGPLARTELGDLAVQGVDYAYTLQGWLKGVNSTAISGLPDGTCSTGTANDVLNLYLRSQYGQPGLYIARQEINFLNEFESNTGDEFEAYISPTDGNCIPANTTFAAGGGGDMGRDGNSTSTTARDAYGFSLNYYSDDYKPINNSNTPFATNVYNLPAVTGGSATTTGANLYNGNIASMLVSIPKLAAINGNPGRSELLYGYRYDQLNRLVGMNAYTGLNRSTNQFTPSGIQDYQEVISYDPNGNIETYKRNGTLLAYGSPTPTQRLLPMDNLTYRYYDGNNQLNHVGDDVTFTNNYTEDIDNQSANNYQYDKIGNLKKDGLNTISWTVYGKIQSISKAGGTISYTYDAAGNRVSKTAGGKTTVYVRDAQGNVMSLYEGPNSGSASTTELVQKEVHLYGSSRLGIMTEQTVTTVTATTTLATGYGDLTTSTFTRGETVLELSNHLGNVLTTVSDRLLAVNDGSTGVAYYMPDVVSATDYAPFGMGLVGRSYSNETYRYGFNGQEHSTEIGDDSYTAQFWEYDARIGRRWNVDPVVKAGSSSYSCFSNSPLFYVDKKGNDTLRINGKDKSEWNIVFGDGTKVHQVDLTKYLNVNIGNRTFNLTGYAPDAIGMDISGSLGLPFISGQVGANVLWHTRGEQNEFIPEVHLYIGRVASSDFKKPEAKASGAASVSLFMAWAKNFDANGKMSPSSDSWVANGYNWTGYFFTAGATIPTPWGFSAAGSLFTSNTSTKPKETDVWYGVSLGVGVGSSITGKSTSAVDILKFSLDNYKSLFFSQTDYYMIYGNGNDKSTRTGKDVSGRHLWPSNWVNQNKD